MAKLEQLGHLATLEELGEKIEEAVRTLDYSEMVRSILTVMLRIEEEQRPDFLELARSLSLKQRSGLASFRQEMRADDVSMKSSMQLESISRCPQCSNALSLPTALCAFCSQSLDCAICSKRFQPGKESWRTHLSPESQVDLNSVCSEACAHSFLQLVGADLCVFCGYPISQQVQLPCNHCFCSPSCLFLYLMRCTYCYTVPAVIRCPACLVPLADSFPDQVFGSELSELVYKYRQEHCAECSSTVEFGQALSCGYHSLCAHCKTSQGSCRYCSTA